mmetsp:Transcript_13815/g.27509  ORF Transcript_13815/g.27509 Transcript_13815/m.27509 type:complete len:89 (-) Transcript_13815:228-494(-)
MRALGDLGGCESGASFGEEPGAAEEAGMPLPGRPGAIATLEDGDERTLPSNAVSCEFFRTETLAAVPVTVADTVSEWAERTEAKEETE